MEGRRILALFLALVAVSYAQDEAKPCEVDSARVCVNVKDVVLDEGEELELKFRLPMPIICVDDPWNCTVDALITNTRPDEVYLSHCHVHWNLNNWWEEQTVYVRGVEDFIDDGEKEFELVIEPIISRSLFYKGHKPDNVKIKTKSRPTATCSSTTDPNYNTFDNKRYTWNHAGAAVLWSAHHRDFEVQSLVNGGRNCGTAIRQGCDIFVFDSCSNRLKIKSHIQSSQNEAPSFKEVTDNTYIVTFPKSSGAEVKIVNNVKIWRTGQTHCGWSGCFTTWTKHRSEWQDVYVQAPGSDFGYEDTGAAVERPRTSGLCGSFDNDRSNDPKNGNAFVIPVASSLFRTTPPCVPRSPPPEPDHSMCTYVPKKVVRPILLDPNAEDITDLVKSMPMDFDEEDDEILFEDVPHVEPTPEEIDDVEEGCANAINNSPGAAICATVGTNLTKFIEGCVQDILLQRDEDLKFGAVDAMLDECKFLLAGRIDLFEQDDEGNLTPSSIQTEVINGSCPHLCNFKGVCENGTCICDAGWAGPQCSIASDSVPNVLLLSPHKCDTRTGCKEHVMISGEDFLRSDEIACKFGSEIVPAEFIADVEVRCPLPDYKHEGASEKVLNVSVTVNGNDFTESLPYVHYDSKCQVCRGDGQCMRRDGTCAVDNICYLEGEADPNNPCKTCQPDVDSEAFTFDLTDSREACKSKFEKPLYITHVPESTETGEVVLECKASNDLLADMTDNTLNYDLSSEAAPHFGITTFQGVAYIRISQALDFESKEDFNFDIFVRDSAGNVDTSSVTIHLLNINEKPIFSKTSYVATLKENDSAQQLFVVEATDDDSRGDNQDSDSWGKIVFSLVAFRFESEADLFAIDPQTGAVRTTGPLDYETKQVHHFSVRASDGDLAFETVPVVVTVLNQNEPPTFVSLSTNTVEENAPIGTVVGVFTTEDPDPDQTFEYTFVNPSSKFELKKEGKKTSLVTKEVLDYEDGANYEVSISSSDNGSPSFSVSATFGVIVLDRNDAPGTIYVSDLLSLGKSEAPQTLPPRTPLKVIPEDQPARSVLATLSCDDPDKNDFHTFELRDDDNGFFSVSDQQLILMKELDFETDKEHTILVIARDSEGAESPEQPFTFQITDVAENPKHIQLTPIVDLAENSSPGTVLGTISAVDDEAQPMTLDLQEEFKDKFALGETTCEPLGEGLKCEAQLTLVGDVDFEESPFENIVVMAVSNSDPDQQSQIVVPIPVVDSNDAPQAVDLSTDSLEEHIEPGTKVADLSAVDEDDQNGEDKYDFKLKDHTDLFEIRTDANGDSAVYFIGDKDDIDYETMEKKEITFTIEVTDHGVPPLSEEYPVTINVADKPVSLVLEGNQLEEYVEGSTPEKVSVGKISLDAYDDPDQVPTFSIAHDPTGLFQLEVDPSGKSASLVAHPDASVDYESLKQTNVKVNVDFQSQSGKPSLPSVSQQFPINVTPRNEKPSFDAMTHIPNPVSLSPNMQPNTFLFKVFASDPDSQDKLTFSICDGDTFGVLTVNPSTGEVFVAKSPASTSLPKGKEVDIDICVSDGQKSDTFSVTVKQILPEITLVNNPDQLADNQERGPQGDSPTSSPSSSDSTATTAAIVGVVFGILILLLAVAFFMFRHQDKANLAAYPLPANMAANPVYSKAEEPVYHAAPLAGGAMNPTYEWHLPNYAREDCYDILSGAPIGGFVVRNYAPTPGWYMLHTKMAHSIRDDKIRLNPDGTLQLVNPTVRGQPHPTFADLAELIEYYSNPSQTEFPVVLQAAPKDSELYDAVWERHVRSDKDAPALPIKEGHRDMIEAVAMSSDEIYSNTADARLALGPGATETLKKKKEASA